MRYYDPRPGESISFSIEHVIAMANGFFDSVSFTFNGVELIVDCNSEKDEIYRKYRDGYDISQGLLPSELFEI